MNTLKQAGGALLVAFGMLAAGAPAMAQSAQATASGQPALSEQAQHGHDLFLKNGCYLCHGTVGQGGVGPAIAVDLLPYVALSAYVRAPSGEMPPFSEKILKDADLRDIYAYLSALPAPKSPDSIPLLPKVTMSNGK
jgi:ubiquinol-cytochrome c reductase cytochrome c subunit